jgi:cation diffusion facilitator CzcD-associated flavoprotein CzcO
MTSGIDIAVVGAGPAGLYAAEELSARRADVRVDVRNGPGENVWEGRG